MRRILLILLASGLAACGSSQAGSGSGSSGLATGSGGSTSTGSTGSTNSGSTGSTSASSASSGSGSGSSNSGSGSGSSTTSTSGSSGTSGYRGSGVFAAGVRARTFTDPGYYGDGDIFPCTGAVADFDGDGKDELAIESYLSNGGVHLFRGIALAEDATTLPATNGAITAGDATGDGLADVVSPSILASSPTVAYLGYRDGGFSAAVNSTAVDNGGSVATLADADGDRVPDLITSGGAYTGTGHVFVYKGDGDGGFALENDFHLAYPADSSTAPAVADLNHDGLPDLGFVPEGGGSLQPEVEFLERLVDGGYVAHTCPAPVNDVFRTVVSGDFLARGHAQLAALASAQFEVYDGFDCDAGVSFPSSFPDDVAVGDLNGDGVPDLAILGARGTITPVLSQPGPDFVVAAPYTVPTFGVGSPQSVFAGDFDGDRRLDLAVLSTNLDAGGGDLVVFRGL